MKRRVNLVTVKELEKLAENEDTYSGGAEYLPCGAWSGAYWSDENRDRYTCCAAGTCQYRYGKQSKLWHRNVDDFGSNREMLGLVEVG